MNTQYITNIALRISTLLSKFLFIFFLVKYLEPSSIGHYGLFVAAISLGLYAVGLEYYSYTTRIIARKKNNERGEIIKEQITLSIFSYLTILPITIYATTYIEWPQSLTIWYAIILILEHVNQEIYRLLISLSKQLKATINLFVRNAIWPPACILAMNTEQSTRNLDSVMFFWSIAGGIAAIVGIIFIKQEKLGGWNKSINYKRIVDGVKTSAILLIATITFRMIQTTDRYLIEYLTNIEVVAAYTFYTGITGTLIVLLDASVFSYLYPKLIKLQINNDALGMKKEMKVSIIKTTIVCIAFAFASTTLLQSIVEWSGKPIYKEMIYIYPWIISAATFHALSLIANYGLYAKNADKLILISHVIGLISFILITKAISIYDKLLAVPIGVLISFMIIFAIKNIFFFTKVFQKSIKTS